MPQLQIAIHIQMSARSTELLAQADLEAADRGLDAAYNKLVSLGMNGLLAACFACLHIITTRRLDRRRGQQKAHHFGSGCSGLPQCAHCEGRDHISKPVGPSAAVSGCEGVAGMMTAGLLLLLGTRGPSRARGCTVWLVQSRVWHGRLCVQLCQRRAESPLSSGR